MSETAAAWVGWLMGLVAGAVLAQTLAFLISPASVLLPFVLGMALGLPMSLLGIWVAGCLHPDAQARTASEKDAES